jgi:hypothetical protein
MKARNVDSSEMDAYVKRLEAEEAAEFEEAFGEMLSEREVRERDGYELAMHYLYESLKAQGKVE